MLIRQLYILTYMHLGRSLKYFGDLKNEFSDTTEAPFDIF